MGRRSVLGIVSVVCATLVAAAAHAGVQVPRKIPFSPTAGSYAKVEQECQLQTQLPAAIAQFGTDVLSSTSRARAAARTARRSCCSEMVAKWYKPS